MGAFHLVAEGSSRVWHAKPDAANPMPRIRNAPCPMIDLTAGRFRRIITDMIYMTATHTFSRCLMTSTQAGLRERCAW